MKVQTLKQKFIQQAKNEKIIRKALKRVEQLEAIRQAEELKLLEEAKLNEIYKKAANSVYEPMKRVSISKSGDITEFSVQDIVLKNKGALSTTDSIWAPWSISYRKSKCI